MGKVFKPDLRRRAIIRVFDEALAKAGLAVHVEEVVEDKKRGLVARLKHAPGVQDEAVAAVLGQFAQGWDWAA